MAETVVGRDHTPFDDLTPEQEGWLAEVQEHVRASDHLVRLGETEEAAEAEDFVVYRDPRGPWQAGRYIGELALDGRRLEIRPRLGEVVIEQWLGEILNLIAVPETASRQPSKSFIAGRRRALSEREARALRPLAIFTRPVAGNLAATRRSQGDLAGARRTCSRARRALGEDHPDTLTAAGNLAVMKTRRLEGA